MLIFWRRSLLSVLEYDAPARVAAVERELARFDARARVAEVERQIAALDVVGRVAAI